MANILLRLSILKADILLPPPALMDEIEDSSEGTPRAEGEVVSRPLSHDMNNLVIVAGVPRDVLPSIVRTFATEQEWMLALADMHFAHLAFQHKDAINGPSDARGRYGQVGTVRGAPVVPTARS